ncbi:MAG TPA: hypothetical protein VIJ94_13415, partial [Caulobacteraceae bacterium]
MLLIGLAASVFMALAAPFGTSGEPILERLAFWLVGTFAAFAAARALDLRLTALLPGRVGRAGRAAALIAIITVPAAVIASTIAAQIQHRPIDWSLCLKTMPQIAMVGAGFSAVLMLADRPPRPKMAAA